MVEGRKIGGGNKKSGTEKIPDPIPNVGEARDKAGEQFGADPVLAQYLKGG